LCVFSAADIFKEMSSGSSRAQFSLDEVSVKRTCTLCLLKYFLQSVEAVCALSEAWCAVIKLWKKSCYTVSLCIFCVVTVSSYSCGMIEVCVLLESIACTPCMRCG